MEFLRTQGTIIVSESGEEVLFKGFGMGNWLTQEGFLFGSSVFSTDFGEFVRAEKMDRGRSINQTIIELCGQTYAQNFWKQWQRNYFGKADIEDLAKKGFNSVRLPLNARVFWPDLGLVGPLLESAGRLGVPVWMGETGGSPEWMATFFEMLYENHIGVNVWCQKGVDDADAATLYTFSVLEGFDIVKEYAHKGGPKPGYEESIKIFDQLLENIKLENCELHQDRCDAILRQPGSSVPAIGYDMLPGVGESFQGKYPYCIFCGYRREDHMHLVYEKGFTPYEAGQFAGMGAGRTPKYGDWNHILLMLEEGDFTCYRKSSSIF